MLRLCELYAIDHTIIFNAIKSQLLYFGSNPLNDLCTLGLSIHSFLLHKRAYF